jgi:hypothetical protein
MTLPATVSLVFLMLGFAGTAAGGKPPSVRYSWHSGTFDRTVERSVPAPSGYARFSTADGSFGAWLRGLPLKPAGAAVHLFDGRLKDNQRAHHAVIDIDVGVRDLQQCADAVIRLRAEYLFAAGAGDSLCFRFTSGDAAAWLDWQKGMRPRVEKNRVAWARKVAPDSSYKVFRGYLDEVFTYAGSASLRKELDRVRDPARIEPGDVFIQGGFPGHAALVLDVAIAVSGERIFLLGQSFMPAQEIHILGNPGAGTDPWYPAAAKGKLLTPEWTFERSDLRRFGKPACAPRAIRKP